MSIKVARKVGASTNCQSYPIAVWLANYTSAPDSNYYGPSTRYDKVFRVLALGIEHLDVLLVKARSRRAKTLVGLESRVSRTRACADEVIPCTGAS